MSDKAFAAMAIYEELIGQEEGVGDWLKVDQERINMFADATLDETLLLAGIES